MFENYLFSSFPTQLPIIFLKIKKEQVLSLPVL